MASSSRPDQKLNLGQLPQLNLGQTRSASSTAANSPVEAPAAGSRYPLGNGLGAFGSTALGTRNGAGSPSKEFGSRLFPSKRYDVRSSRCSLRLTINCTVLEKYKRKKVFRHRYGVLPPPVAIPRRYARRSPNRQAATASQTSTNPFKKHKLHRELEDVCGQALCQHAYLLQVY